MRCVATGYDPADPSCPNRALLEGLARAWAGLAIAPAIDPAADVLFVLLDRRTGPRVFARAMPSEATLVIGLVLELHRSALPLLKLCDKLVYTNPYQRRLVEELLGLRYTATVLPRPSSVAPARRLHGDCLVWIDDDFHSGVVERALQRARAAMKWHPGPQVRDFHVLVEVPPGEEPAFAALRAGLAAISPRLRAIDRRGMPSSELHALLGRCLRGQFFSNGATPRVFDELLARRDSRLVDFAIADRQILADFGAAGLAMAPVDEVAAHNFRCGSRLTHAQLAHALRAFAAAGHGAILARKATRFAAMPADTLADLTIVHGAPRDEAFVVSICFRNQVDKIARCLASVAAQRGGHSVGVVIVDDASTDGSLDAVRAFLVEHPLRACVVANRERKYAARNFHNVVHLLTTRDDSVIVELDGDDFLAGDSVLEVLARAYDAGAALTRGSYRRHPPDHPHFPDAEVLEHHRRHDFDDPWNIARCSAWLHLRSCRRGILRQIEREHFADRRSGTWLTARHDTAIQPRAIELAAGRAVMIEDVLYAYDVSGAAHDHDRSDADEDHLRLFADLDRIWHPLLLDG